MLLVFQWPAMLSHIQMWPCKMRALCWRSPLLFSGHNCTMQQNVECMPGSCKLHASLHGEQHVPWTSPVAITQHPQMHEACNSGHHPTPTNALGLQWSYGQQLGSCIVVGGCTHSLGHNTGFTDMRARHCAISFRNFDIVTHAHTLQHVRSDSSNPFEPSWTSS